MGGGCNLVAHTASRQEAADRLICAARRSKRHDTYERLQCTTKRQRAARAQRPKLSSGGAGGRRRRGAGRGDHADHRRVPLEPVRAARAPWVVPTGHGAGAGRRASRSTSRARLGTPPLARAGRRGPRSSWTGHGVHPNFDTSHDTSRRRERTVRSRVFTTQRGHSTQEPRSGYER